MAKYNKYAKRFVELSLNPVPVKSGSKEPIRKSHTTKIDNVDNYVWNDIGISTGYASLNLEVIDFDLDKTDNPDEFMKDYLSKVPQELFDKLVRSKTTRGGFHFFYRCEKIESNKKLARNSKGEATIETRGIGGYVKCFPSEGYKIVSDNSFDNIPIITEQERALLFILAKQKDELVVRDTYKRFNAEEQDIFKKFPKFNNDYKIGIELLKKHGWVIHSESSKWINFTRPNSKSGDLHGGYNIEGLFFQTFSNAQDVFITTKGYNNHHLFCELEHKGDYKKGYADLYNLGYGIQDSKTEKKKIKMK